LKKVSIGGQAVLEGVMMKGPESYALSVRKPDKEIEVKVVPYRNMGDRSPLFRVPIIRGVVNFIESLYIGMKTLMDSAEYFEDEEDTKADVDGTKTKANDTKEKSAKDNAYLIGTLLFSLVIAIGLFMLLPAFLAGLLEKVTDNQILINLVEGIIRITIFILYVVLISQMNDIKRTFMYHGAEHKTINCLEAGEELTVANVMKHTRYHKRCGSSFLVIVMIISILMFMFVRTDTMWLRLLSRVLLVPVIAGLSYEVIRFAGRSNSALASILSVPGKWVQALTTKEPEEDMVEVAIKSVEGVIDWHEYIDCVNNNSFTK